MKSLSAGPLRPSWVHIACTRTGLELKRTFRVQEKGSKQGLRQSLRMEPEVVGSHACVSTSSSMLRTSLRHSEHPLSEPRTASNEKRKGADLAPVSGHEWTQPRRWKCSRMAGPKAI